MITINRQADLAALILDEVKIPQAKRPIIVAIDGPCASGKSVLALGLIQELKSASMMKTSLIKLDHFFLPPELRSQQRLNEPGGNIHYERFLSEIVAAVHTGSPIKYRHFDCRIMDYAESSTIDTADIIILEGVYSHHPKWRSIIDLTVFCKADYDERLRRLDHREGSEKLQRFISTWIPMEDSYFNYYGIQQACDIIFESDFLI